MRRLFTTAAALLLMLAGFSIVPAGAAPDREQEVRRAVTAFVTARTGGMGWDVRVRRLTVADRLVLPDGEISYEVVAPQQWEGWGSVSIAVLARQKERVVRNISVRLEVEALTDMAVTQRQIEHGTILTAADVMLQKREITPGTHQGARTVEELVGRKARTTLRANQPVRPDQVEKIPLIKTGQLVTIVAENDVLKISVSGSARSAGAEGDIIRVQNLTSQKEIPARVISATTVQVAF